MLLLSSSLAALPSTALAENIYQQAIDNAERTASDHEADIRRKPAQVLAFFDIQPQQSVLDLFSGGGYYTELSAMVVGDKGSVDAHNNTAYINYIGQEKLLKRYKNNRLANVKQLHQEANQLTLCQSCYDRVLMILTFHDLFYVDEKNGWPAIDAKALMRKVKDALKPDGLVGIVDHNAAPNSHISTAQNLHRIDPELIKSYMTDWGFRLKSEAQFLHNAEDSGELPMWDPSVRGYTNRAVLLFQLK